jgi:hypothetical protein
LECINETTFTAQVLQASHLHHAVYWDRTLNNDTGAQGRLLSLRASQVESLALAACQSAHSPLIAMPINMGGCKPMCLTLLMWLSERLPERHSALLLSDVSKVVPLHTVFSDTHQPSPWLPEAAARAGTSVGVCALLSVPHPC